MIAIWCIAGAIASGLLTDSGSPVLAIGMGTLGLTLAGAAALISPGPPVHSGRELSLTGRFRA